MELSNKITVESWVSSDNDKEIHFYIDNKYLFGFNPHIISREQIAKFLQELGYKTDPEKWVK